MSLLTLMQHCCPIHTLTGPNPHLQISFLLPWNHQQAILAKVSEHHFQPLLEKGAIAKKKSQFWTGRRFSLPFPPFFLSPLPLHGTDPCQNLESPSHSQPGCASCGIPGESAAPFPGPTVPAQMPDALAIHVGCIQTHECHVLTPGGTVWPVGRLLPFPGRHLLSQ